jgi:hypothetical protein
VSACNRRSDQPGLKLDPHRQPTSLRAARWDYNVENRAVARMLASFVNKHRLSTVGGSRASARNDGVYLRCA